jgi:hypothetical protein
VGRGGEREREGEREGKERVKLQKTFAFFLTVLREILLLIELSAET